MNSQSDTSIYNQELEAINADTRLEFGRQNDFEIKTLSWRSTHSHQNEFIKLQWNQIKEAVKENENFRTLASLADLHFLRGNYPGAKKYYSKALHQNPNFISLYEKIIFIYLSEKNISKVEEYYKKLLSITNWRTDFMHNYILFKTTFYEDEETTNELIALCYKGLKNDPKNYALINTLGLLYLKLQKEENALECFKGALKINSKYSHSLNNIGTSLSKSGRIEEAIKYYYKAIENDPNYLTGYENLSQIYISIGKYSEALNVLKKASANKLDLSHDWEHQMAWLYIKNDEFENAINWYRKQVENESDNHLLYNNLGYSLLRAGNIPLGERYLNRAVTLLNRKIKKREAIDERSLLAFYNLGRIAISNRDLNKVKDIINNIERFQKNNAFVDYLNGAIKNIEHDYESAKEYYLKALKKSYEIPEVYTDLAFIYESIEENYPEAIKLLREGIRKGNNQFLLVNNLIYALIESGELKQAEELLGQLPEDSSPLLIANRGLLSFKKNDFKKGEFYFKKAVKEFEGGHLENVAKQYWLLEKTRYYIRKNEQSNARDIFEELNKIRGTYLDSRIDRLKKEFFTP